MKQLRTAFEYRQIRSPSATRALMRRFAPQPPGSLSALLRRTGPFVPARDAYQFTNGNPGWPITNEDAQVLRARYQRHVDGLFLVAIAALRSALTGLTIPVPMTGNAALPLAAVDFVIHRVSADLRHQLLDKVVSAVPGRFGRCGGMAFSAYDFFLVGWPVSAFNVRPASGDLRQYIWTRLLDSLELNAATFFEWIMVLHILPPLSRAATIALGAAAGAVVGGAFGAALGALLLGRNDVLGLGGPAQLVRMSLGQWPRLRTQLEQQAAWPVGLVYGDSAVPIDQHQVLAIGWNDHGNGVVGLRLWDNNDMPSEREVLLDLQHGTIDVARAYPTLAGLICEDYQFVAPPLTLRR